MIKNKTNNISGTAPVSSQLELGELAVNSADGKIYLKKSDGTVINPMNFSTIEAGKILYPQDMAEYSASMISSRAIVGKQTNMFIGYVGTGSVPQNPVQKNLNFWGSDLDLTPISFFPGIKSSTLISPQHIIYGAHDPHPIGMNLFFLSRSGQLHVRTITNTIDHPSYSALNSFYPDISVGLLNQPLPNDVSYCKILKSEWLENISSSTEFIRVFVTDQERKMFNVKMVSTQRFDEKYITTMNAPENFYEFPVAGDSSSPLFMILDGQFVLVSIVTFGNFSGTFVNVFKDDINAMMNQLGGNYSLTEFDSSNFNHYPIFETSSFLEFKISTSNTPKTIEGDLKSSTLAFTIDQNSSKNTVAVGTPNQGYRYWIKNIPGNSSIQTLKFFSSNAWSRPLGNLLGFRIFNGPTIYDLSFQNCPHLERLAIKNCSDESLDFSGLPNLVNLELENHNLSNVNLETNAQLTDLILRSGPLEQIVAPDSLLTLDVSNNNLSHLDFSELTQLNTLRCSGNNFLSLDVTELNSLSSFECSNNLLTSLNFNSTLVYLDCSHNQLTSLDISGLNSPWVYCSNNQLISLRAQGVSFNFGGNPSYYYTYAPNSLMAQNNNLSSEALNQLFSDLAPGNGILFVSGNPGALTCDPTIATNKGYTVITI